MPLDSPYREARLAGGPLGLMPVSLDGHGYLVDMRPEKGFQRASIDVLAGRQNRTKGLSALVPTDIWWETRETWDAGQGQRQADRQESLDSRYYDGVGVDPWTKWQLTLLPDAEPILQTSGAPHVHLVTVGQYVSEVAGTKAWLVASVGTTLRWTDQYVPGNTVWTTRETGSSIVSMTSDGEAAITAHADGSVRRMLPDGTSTTLFSTTKAPLNYVGYAKGHVLVGFGADLWDATYSRKVWATNPLAGWRWVAVTEGLSAIYALGGIGDK